ncbi:hypothetical protein J6590_067994 [Homalodisca vitripennis]|nr:hypothetical protein J6590_067994 [Homalodisca vitripennis]
MFNHPPLCSLWRAQEFWNGSNSWTVDCISLSYRQRNDIITFLRMFNHPPLYPLWRAQKFGNGSNSWTVGCIGLFYGQRDDIITFLCMFNHQPLCSLWRAQKFGYGSNSRTVGCISLFYRQRNDIITFLRMFNHPPLCPLWRAQEFGNRIHRILVVLVLLSFPTLRGYYYIPVYTGRAQKFGNGSNSWTVGCIILSYGQRDDIITFLCMFNHPPLCSLWRAQEFWNGSNSWTVGCISLSYRQRNDIITFLCMFNHPPLCPLWRAQKFGNGSNSRTVGCISLFYRQRNDIITFLRMFNHPPLCPLWRAQKFGNGSNSRTVGCISLFYRQRNDIITFVFCSDLGTAVIQDVGCIVLTQRRYYNIPGMFNHPPLCPLWRAQDLGLCMFNHHHSAPCGESEVWERHLSYRQRNDIITFLRMFNHQPLCSLWRAQEFGNRINRKLVVLVSLPFFPTLRGYYYIPVYAEPSTTLLCGKLRNLETGGIDLLLVITCTPLFYCTKLI